MKLKDMLRGAKRLVLGAACAIGLTATAAELEAVQLWVRGPYWATVNVGTSEVQGHPEYGGLYKFDGDEAKNAAKSLGDGWRLPTQSELEKLAEGEYCTSTWDDDKKGRTFTGKDDYKSNSIFLPAAGYCFDDFRMGGGGNGYYRSSTDAGPFAAVYFVFDSSGVDVNMWERGYGMSVRAVRDTPLVKVPPSVKVDTVESADPWDSATGKITVNYTLGGVDAATKYKVAFDITAGGQTASVTNDAAKLANGATNAVINTANLFGPEVVGANAKVKVSLIAIKPKPDLGGVQLWKDGPFWAEANLGEGPTGLPEYGALYEFAEAGTAVKSLLDEEWCVPTKDDFEKLVNTSYCTKEWDSIKKGYTFTGATEGYKDKSIFLPAAGINTGKGRTFINECGSYWSSTELDGDFAYYLYFDEDYASNGNLNRGWGSSVRAVWNAGGSGEVVASDEKDFRLGPIAGSEGNPWKVGEGVKAWTNGTELVVQGAGTVEDLSKIPSEVVDDIETIVIPESTVEGAEENAFEGFDNISLTLPDGWQGELPDKDGKWYGATDVTLTAMPLMVSNVRTATHWPWDGKIDVSYDLVGSGKVQLSTALTTNGVKVCDAKAANITGKTEIDLDQVGGVTNGVKFTWDAKADCPAGFNSTKAKVKVSVKKFVPPAD